MAFWAVTLCLVLVTRQDIWALNPAKSIAQYRHDVWKEKPGLPETTIQKITQTRDGYLWLATGGGLIRFDGVRFTRFDKSSTRSISDNEAQVLYEDRQSSLWIGTFSGLSQLKDGKFRSYSTRDGLSSDVVTDIFEDSKGDIWIKTEGGVDRLRQNQLTTLVRREVSEDPWPSMIEDHGSLWIATNKGLLRFSNERMMTYTTRDGLPADEINALVLDREGSLWLGTHAGLGCLRNGKFSRYQTTDGLLANDISALCLDVDGSLWIGSARGLNRYKDGVFTRFTNDKSPLSNQVTALCLDRDGNLWVSAYDGELYRFRNGRFSSDWTQDLFSNDYATTVFEDREGSLWVGTKAGTLHRLKDGEFTSYTTRDGLSENYINSIAEDLQGQMWIGTRNGLNRMNQKGLVHYSRSGISKNVDVKSIYPDRDGSLWIGTADGIIHLQGDRSVLYTARDGLPKNDVVSLYQGRDGSIWAGTYSGGLGHLKDGKFTQYTTRNGLSNDFVRGIYEDLEGSVWIGTRGGGLNRLKNGKFEHFGIKEGLGSDGVMSLWGDRDGSLWIGTRGGGLNRFKDGKFSLCTVRDGLFSDYIFQILEDEQGTLWMTSNEGIFKVVKRQLIDFAEGRSKSVTSVSYGTQDGMSAPLCTGGIQPAGWKSRDGRLWFPTNKGFVMIDPAKVPTAPAIPVVLEDLLVDDQQVRLDHQVVLPPGNRKLEFRYSGLSLLAPERIAFRYKLEGFDKDWIEAGSRRIAYYTHLSAGTYRFKAAAQQADGTWIEAQNPFEFSLEPHFYETPLFYVCCFSLLAFGGPTFHRLRLKSLKAREQELMHIVDTKTQQLMESSRLAGMAEVATAVLHNVGNVLNSVNVSANVLSETLRRSKLPNLMKATALMRDQRDHIGAFLENDSKGKQLPVYLEKLADHLAQEQELMVNELGSLSKNIDHIKDIVSMQQSYARVSGVAEWISPVELIEDAVRMHAGALSRHQVEIVRDLDESISKVLIEKHKMLQILVNLISNAKYAMDEANLQEKRLTLKVEMNGNNSFKISVGDNGVGISPENLVRIFGHGFTTKQTGHGFGLHSSALAAKEMGGLLSVHSDGLGTGATFTLQLPLHR